MQYRARILDHSRLGKCFRRCHRSYKCHLWRHLAVHIRRRMSNGIYPGRDKTGDFAICLHQFPLVGTSISALFCPTSSRPFLSRRATLKVAEHSFGSLWLYVICSIMARKRLQLTSWNLANENYTNERFWLTGKFWRFRSFHGNMNDWIQPLNFTFAQFA